jgi:hypothetical protein
MQEAATGFFWKKKCMQFGIKMNEAGQAVK